MPCGASAGFGTPPVAGAAVPGVVEAGAAFVFDPPKLTFGAFSAPAAASKYGYSLKPNMPAQVLAIVNAAIGTSRDKYGQPFSVKVDEFVMRYSVVALILLSPTEHRPVGADARGDKCASIRRRLSSDRNR